MKPANQNRDEEQWRKDGETKAPRSPVIITNHLQGLWLSTGSDHGPMLHCNGMQGEAMGCDCDRSRLYPAPAPTRVPPLTITKLRGTTEIAGLAFQVVLKRRPDFLSMASASVQGFQQAYVGFA